MMNKKSIIALVLSAMSFSAFAATEIKKEDVANYQHLGDLSVATSVFSYDDALKYIEKKVDDSGAKYFYIIRMSQNQKNNGWSSNVAIYNEK